MENKFREFPAELKTEESGYFEGYASTFGGEPDTYGDVIVEGAFRDTLIKGGYGGRGIKMLWQHDNRNPIGRWDEIIEDSKGLRVKGQLAIKTTQGKDAHELMKIGAIDGLSIGYDTVDSLAVTEGKIKRYLKKVDLWEISPVTFAANPRANITLVKAAIEAATNERELEQALRDGGLSIRAAQYIVSQCKHVLLSKVSDSDLEPTDGKPYPNEHACRLEEPSQFDSFARRNNAAQVDGKRIDHIFGIKNGKSKLQAMRYPKDVWQASDARTHCNEKGGSFEAAKELAAGYIVKILESLRNTNLKLTDRRQ